MIFLDTHVAVWLYTGDLGLIPEAVQRELDEHPLVISPMVTLELQYLHEVGRITVGGTEIVSELSSSIGLTADDLSLGEVVGVALSADWTRDPFDRLIVAHADLRRAALATKDAAILAQYGRAFWG